MLLAPAYGVGGTAGGGGSDTSALAVTVPGFAYGAVAKPGTVPVTSENISAAITGGTGIYTILWSAVAVTGTWTISNPTGLMTQIITSVGSGLIKSGTFHAVVSDGVSSVTSATFQVDLENYGTL